MDEKMNMQNLLLPDTQDATVLDENIALTYKFEAFEGPLDLLLTLITKNKIDIYDICIEDLLKQYMEQINLMKEENMDIASEFLEMASRLVYIKSVMLLPKYEEEAEELKKELTGQLLEYQECRRVAQMLAPLVSFDTYSKEPSPVEHCDTSQYRYHYRGSLCTQHNASGNYEEGNHFPLWNQRQTESLSFPGSRNPPKA